MYKLTGPQEHYRKQDVDIITYATHTHLNLISLAMCVLVREVLGYEFTYTFK